MSIYKDGELLAHWRKEGRDAMMAEYRRLRKAAESCQSHKDGNPGDYSKSMAIIADCYLRAAACFDESPVETKP